jgi:hypothetical protein
MEEIEEKELLRMVQTAEKAEVCFRCGSKPLVERHERLSKYFVKCPTCKDMSFSAIILDAASLRWNESNRWRKMITEVAEHNGRARAIGAKKLPSSVEEADALNRFGK